MAHLHYAHSFISAFCPVIFQTRRYHPSQEDDLEGINKSFGDPSRHRILSTWSSWWARRPADPVVHALDFWSRLNSGTDCLQATQLDSASFRVIPGTPWIVPCCPSGVKTSLLRTDIELKLTISQPPPCPIKRNLSHAQPCKQRKIVRLVKIVFLPFVEPFYHRFIWCCLNPEVRDVTSLLT
jgi:hypothetical protein